MTIRAVPTLAMAAALCLLSACPEQEPVEETGDDAGSRRDAAFDAGLLEGPDAGPRVDAGAFDAGEADGGPQLATTERYWANTQWPPYATLAPGGKLMAYGQVWVPGGTDRAGAMPGLTVELGHGPSGSDPAAGGWSWKQAAYNEEKGDNDEYMAELIAPASGPRDYAFRYRVAGARWDGHGEWLYANLAGVQPGSAGYASDNAGKLAVREAGFQLKVATLNLACLRDDPAARLDAAAERFAALGVDAVALQEVCADAAVLPGVAHSAEYLARKLSESGREYRALFHQTHLANDVTPEGIGLVVAYPILASSVAELPSSDFPRRALTALLATRAGMVAMTSTHFSFSPTAAAIRESQAAALLAAADDWQKNPARPGGTLFVVGGDFNADPGEQAIAAMKVTFLDAWAQANGTAPGLTFPSYNPAKRIDYLFVRPPEGVTASIAGASLEFAEPYSGSDRVSDHVGVSTLFSLQQ